MGRSLTILLMICHGALSATTVTERLDGLPVQAVDALPSAWPTELSVGTSLYPLDPYYLGFSVSGGFTKFFSPTLGWEILSGAVAFSTQKDLVAQLAERGVTPATLERLEYLISSSVVWVFSQGKSLLLQSYIQRFRSAFVLGPGLVKTSLNSYLTPNFGFRFDTTVSESFTWRLEIRDYLQVTAGRHFLSVTLGANLLL